MTVELDNTDKLKALLVDARSFGVVIATPDINSGTYRFEPVSPTAVRYGLGAIKGTGQGAIEAIVAARARRRAVQQPVRLLRPRRPPAHQQARGRGADQGRRLRCAASRALELLASVGLALDWADTQAAHADQGGLFDFGDDDSHGASTQEPALVAAEPWSIKERLTLEKAALGFYLSGHLFDQSATEVRRFAKVRLGRPDRQAASRSCSPASSATCASSTASAAGSRSSSSTTAARRSRRWPTRSCSTPTASC